MANTVHLLRFFHSMQTGLARRMVCTCPSFPSSSAPFRQPVGCRGFAGQCAQYRVDAGGPDCADLRRAGGFAVPEVAEGGVPAPRHRLAARALQLNLVVRMDGFAWMFCIAGAGHWLALVVLYARYYVSPADPVPRFFAFPAGVHGRHDGRGAWRAT